MSLFALRFDAVLFDSRANHRALYERDSALPYEAMAIFAVVMLNAIMGYIQVARAEQALDWLCCVAVASSVLWLRELSKMVARRTGNNKL